MMNNITREETRDEQHKQGVQDEQLKRRGVPTNQYVITLCSPKRNEQQK